MTEFVELSAHRGASRRNLVMILVSLLLLSSSGAFVFVLPSMYPNQLVERFYVDSDSIGLSRVDDLAIHSSDWIVYLATYEYIHRFSLVNDSFLEPLKTNFSSHGGIEGAVDIAILGDGFGDVLFAGPFSDSVVRFLHDGEMGNYTSQEKHNTSNTRFPHVECSYEHDKVFLGTDDKGVGIMSTHGSEISFINETHGLPHNQVTQLKVRGNYLVIGTSGGFALYDIVSQNLSAWSEDDVGGRLQVLSIDYYHSAETVFVGNRDGLFIFKKDGSGFDLDPDHRINSRGDSPLPSDEVFSLELDIDRGCLYIGTEGGLSFMKLSSLPVIHRFLWGGPLETVSIRAITIGLLDRYLYLGSSIDRAEYRPSSLFRIPIDFDEKVFAITRSYTSMGILLSLLVPVIFVVQHVVTHRSLKRYEEEEILEIMKRGESREVEFKETLLFNIHTQKEDKALGKSCIKAVASFLNTCGGTLLIGVTDTREIVGLERDFQLIQKKKKRVVDVEDQFMLKFHKLYNQYRLEEGFRHLIDAYLVTVKGKKVFVAQVRMSKEKVFIEDQGRDFFYIRRPEESEPLPARDIDSFWKQRKKQCG